MTAPAIMATPCHWSATLPLPPSANRIWRRGHGRFHKATQYKVWLRHCGQIIMIQGHSIAIPYRYAMRIVLPEVRIDPDNAVKPISDFLQKQRIIANDKHLRGLVLEVDSGRPGETMRIDLWALPDVAPKRGKRKQLKLTAPIVARSLV